jgi:plasmid stabilization system protein ParE
MAYDIEYLPFASVDILDAEARLYELSPSAADRFAEEILRLTENLRDHPFMYQIFIDDGYFRSMPLPYDYRLFYHVDEENKMVKIHRIIYGRRDLNVVLNENK